MFSQKRDHTVGQAARSFNATRGNQSSPLTPPRFATISALFPPPPRHLLSVLPPPPPFARAISHQNVFSAFYAETYGTHYIVSTAFNIGQLCVTPASSQFGQCVRSVRRPEASEMDAHVHKAMDRSASCALVGMGWQRRHSRKADLQARKEHRMAAPTHTHTRLSSLRRDLWIVGRHGG